MQERRLDGVGLQGSDRYAHNFMFAATVDASGNEGGARDDMPAAADLQVGCIDAEMWLVPLDLSFEKVLYPGVDLVAQSGHPVLGDPAQHSRFDFIIDRPSRVSCASTA